MYVLARNASEHLGRCKLVGLHIHTGGYQSVRPTPKGECVGEALFLWVKKWLMALAFFIKALPVMGMV